MGRTLLRIFSLALFIITIVGTLAGGIISASGPTIEVLHVEGTIVPVVADYIDRGISHAEDENATVCIIELNTPGGLLTATEKIVQRIMNADVPVVVYVSPKGAWAASAGTFITLSAHIAAMTSGTTIGAAHPVAAGGDEIPEEQMKKIVEFSAKWMKTIAEERGRNMEEAELAVTESKSFTDVDALECNLIDLRADNLKSLISQINGWKVILANGEEVTINTTGYEIAKNEMNTIEQFLQTISDPNIAYILLTLATIGLITEISNPGMIFPGVFGGISLFLAFYSLGVLNAYWGGIALILLAIGLFVAEYFTASFGLLTTGGIISLVVGSLILFSHSPGIEVNRGLIAGVTAAIAAFAIFVIGAIIRGQRRRKATGPEGMVGKLAIARTPLDPTGMVLAEGELWTAIAEGGKIEPREKVVITKVEELKLWVTKKSKE
ncbi:MAG: serine protease [Chloroflexi bacterium CG07_land_8_20_14_0_80_45_17]|nr:MAG: serine protease [Chloroflexi bacterium CG23_combo_of_CG06-09_8_20_14_all_45_10]PIU56839.1 MAG: serine protease [Chloroflexi bacterium CG07_land_8_20_14_0_80_45_17]